MNSNHGRSRAGFMFVDFFFPCFATIESTSGKNKNITIEHKAHLWLDFAEGVDEHVIGFLQPLELLDRRLE
jgi:hypothetical protein